MSFKTTLAGEAVVQSVDSGPFERATEHGIAVAQGVPLEAAVLGYDRHDWDRRSSFTWKFLRDSSAEQVRTAFQAIVHADIRLVTGSGAAKAAGPGCLSQRSRLEVLRLWNAETGVVPPPFGFNAFDDTESMYIAKWRSHLDSADIEDAVRKVQSHGYGLAEGAGGQMLIIANPD